MIEVDATSYNVELRRQGLSENERKKQDGYVEVCLNCANSEFKSGP